MMIARDYEACYQAALPLFVCSPLQVTPVRQAAEAALASYIPSINPYSVEDVLPILFAGMAQAKPWQVKVGALQALEALSKSAPRQTARCLPDIVPKVGAGHRQGGWERWV